MSPFDWFSVAVYLEFFRILQEISMFTAICRKSRIKRRPEVTIPLLVFNKLLFPCLCCQQITIPLPMLPAVHSHSKCYKTITERKIGLLTVRLEKNNIMIGNINNKNWWALRALNFRSCRGLARFAQFHLVLNESKSSDKILFQMCRCVGVSRKVKFLP